MSGRYLSTPQADSGFGRTYRETGTLLDGNKPWRAVILLWMSWNRCGTVSRANGAIRLHQAVLAFVNYTTA